MSHGIHFGENVLHAGRFPPRPSASCCSIHFLSAEVPLPSRPLRSFRPSTSLPCAPFPFAPPLFPFSPFPFGFSRPSAPFPFAPPLFHFSPFPFVFPHPFAPCRARFPLSRGASSGGWPGRCVGKWKIYLQMLAGGMVKCLSLQSFEFFIFAGYWACESRIPWWVSSILDVYRRRAPFFPHAGSRCLPLRCAAESRRLPPITW